MSPLTSSILPLLKELRGTHVSLEKERVKATLRLVTDLYKDEMHWTGVSVFEHVLGVLRILLPFEPNEETVIACLLHHVLDVGKMTLAELEEDFGPKVRSLVSGLHLLSHVTLRNRRASIEDLRLMILTVSDDIRVVFILLCDQCYMLETISKTLPLEERRLLGQDTLSLFAPVAARLGIYTLKQRLERAAFPIVYPSDAERISDQLNHVHKRFPNFLDPTAELLKSALKEEGIEAEVQGREKQTYSIFLKMNAKTLSNVDGLHDLFALRVLVSSAEDCYRVLGIIHRIGHPVFNRFKDYIAFPKPNGYQSLHTTVSRLPGLPEGVFSEVQIRTHSMHKEAEFGIAAHWSYKQGGSAERMAQWLQFHKVLTEQHPLGSDEGGPQLLVDQIFVLTPKGNIIELPEGATPLDFAFQIHTDLGLSFRAAKVNGNIVPLDYHLENGDVVEILRNRVPRPSPEWMQFVRMASSRSRLKRHFYSLDRSHFVSRGRDLINNELIEWGLPLLDPDLTLMKFYDGKVLTREEREDILMKVGQDSEKASAILQHLDRCRAVRKSIGAPLKKIGRMQRKDSLIQIDGGVPMPLRYAKCCKPQDDPTQPIAGFVTRTGDVIIHRAKCRMSKNANPSRKIKAWWK